MELSNPPFLILVVLLTKLGFNLQTNDVAVTFSLPQVKLDKQEIQRNIPRMTGVWVIRNIIT